MGAALKDKGDIFKRQYIIEGSELYRLYANAMYDDAIRCYKKAIELDSNFGSFWYNLGLVFNEKCDFKNAVDAYDKSIALDPKNAEVWFGKGKALNKQRKYDEAIHACNKAIEFEPLHSSAWNQKGNILIDQARYLTMQIKDVTWNITNDATFLQINYNYNEAIKVL